MASSDIYVAKQSFATELDGVPIIVNRGATRVRAGHPLLKGREDLFELITVQYDIEKATAAPGERRAAPAPEAAAPVEATATERVEVKTEPEAKAEVKIEAAAKEDKSK